MQRDVQSNDSRAGAQVKLLSCGASDAATAEYSFYSNGTICWLADIAGNEYLWGYWRYDHEKKVVLVCRTTPNWNLPRYYRINVGGEDAYSRLIAATILS
jgi:hypothetical protein